MLFKEIVTLPSQDIRSKSPMRDFSKQIPSIVTEIPMILDLMPVVISFYSKFASLSSINAMFSNVCEYFVDKFHITFHRVISLYTPDSTEISPNRQKS